MIEIGDDGNGREGPGWRPGRGLNSMEWRVKELGGRIHWLPREPKGCLVYWELPLQA